MVVVVVVVSPKPYVVLPCLMHLPIISGRGNRTERMARKDDISTQLCHAYPFLSPSPLPLPFPPRRNQSFLWGGLCVWMLSTIVTAAIPYILLNTATPTVTPFLGENQWYRASSPHAATIHQNLYISLLVDHQQSLLHAVRLKLNHACIIIVTRIWLTEGITMGCCYGSHLVERRVHCGCDVYYYWG